MLAQSPNTWLAHNPQGIILISANFFQNPPASLISFNTIWQFEEKSVTLQARYRSFAYV